ncbi:MAG TPA: hypothetical protein VH519_12415 [Hyphomicrobiaceae bacterium]|jgi:hypothetical protein
MLAENARAQVEHRGPGTQSVLGTDLKQGNSSEALLRRITRKRPDILARYEAGEFKSVRAVRIVAPEAGLDAGCCVAALQVRDVTLLKRLRLPVPTVRSRLDPLCPLLSSDLAATLPTVRVSGNTDNVRIILFGRPSCLRPQLDPLRRIVF